MNADPVLVHEVDIEQTMAATFQFLEVALNQAKDLVPVRQASELVAVLPSCSLLAGRLVLSELIKLDMAKAAELGQMRVLNFYSAILGNFFDPAALPLDLVLEEIHVLRTFQQHPQLEDFKTRFPHLADMLEELLSRPSQSSACRSIERVPQFEDGKIVDDFAIVRTLGRGGFANVYLARQLSMQRLVALKISHRGSDEPVALSQIDHANVVRVYDQRQIVEPEAVLLYMQYIPGGTLADVIRSTSAASPHDLSGRALLACVDLSLLAAGQQPPERNATRDFLSTLDWPRTIAWIGTQLAEGLAAAHERGVMHRDVKPANILLSAEGVPKLADFNVSYSGTAGCAGAAVHFGGSIAYMSPEQLRVANPSGGMDAEDLDNRSDLYSLAIVLWELWHGRRPGIPHEMTDSWHDAVLQQMELRSRAPEGTRTCETAAARVLQKTLRHALQSDRRLRPQNGHQLAGRLRLVLEHRAAEYFEPADASLYGRVRRWPVLMVAALVIFLPNGLAGVLNYQYNLSSVLTEHSDMEPVFVRASICVNCIAFPLGAVFLVLLVRPVRRAMRRARRDQPATPAALDAAWNLGHRTAMVGGILWLIAGIGFPVVLQQIEPSFRMMDVIEFFLSLAICGGIAWIYPFFGISLIATEIYYPAIVASTMVDDQFEKRTKQLNSRASMYLASGAVIPLCALALLAMQGPKTAGGAAGSSLFLLIVIIVTAIALVFAFLAHQRLHSTIQQLRSVLGSPVATGR